MVIGPFQDQEEKAAPFLYPIIFETNNDASRKERQEEEEEKVDEDEECSGLIAKFLLARFTV